MLVFKTNKGKLTLVFKVNSVPFSAIPTYFGQFLESLFLLFKSNPVTLKLARIC